MSEHHNINLLERAAELIDTLESHPSGADDLLIRAVDSNDLDEVHRLVIKFEGELSQEYFKNWDIRVW